jgi:hydroxyacylglutathione hydrolase
MKILKELYAYLWRDPYENNCNTYLIRGEKTLLIDPGHSRHLDRLFAEMEEDGLSPEAIDLLIATHSHPDHIEGVERLLNGPVKMAMSREEERYLHGSGKSLFEMMGQSLPKMKIDFYLREGELHFGEETFHIYSTPGHSPGSLSIYWPERKALFTGDTLFLEGIGRTDFLEGNPARLMESIEKMSCLETEIMLPGHGEILTGKEAVLRNFESIRRTFYPYL